MKYSERNRFRYVKDYLAQRLIDEHLAWLAEKREVIDLSEYPLNFAGGKRRKRKS